MSFSSKNSPGSLPRRKQPLEDLAEADEEPRADHPDDLAFPRLLPAALEQRVLEQPGEADVVGEVLELPRLALARRGLLGERRQVARHRLVPVAELAQERTVDDEVGVAPDRRGEMAVGGAREPRVAEVRRVVARLLERAQDQRRKRLPPTPRSARRTRVTRREIAPASSAASCGESCFGHGRRRHLEVGELARGAA